MKQLNHDIIRGILAWASTADSLDQMEKGWPDDIAGYDPNQEGYVEQVDINLRYLENKGFVTRRSRSEPQTDIKTMSLTAAGWEYLDAIKDDAIWESIKKSAASQGSSLSFAVIEAGVRFHAAQLFQPD